MTSTFTDNIFSMISDEVNTLEQDDKSLRLGLCYC